jgi:uncharacterized membrane protein YgdD (TMEM256/DUF423 family)
MSSNWLRMAALVGFIAVAGGAFGAHGLRSIVDAQALGWWETGARYALGHAAALAAVAWLADRAPGRAVTVAGLAFCAGVLVFTGSLWTMTLTGARWLGAVTPLGGAAMLVGWVSLGVAAGGLSRQAPR